MFISIYKDMFNVMLLEEWQESENYKFDTYLHDLELKIKEWFKTDPFRNITLGNISYNTTNTNKIYVMMLEFNEDDRQWIFHFIIDGSTLEKDDNIEDLDIEYSSIYNDEPQPKEKRSVKSDELTQDKMIELIDEYKQEYDNKPTEEI